MSTYCVPVANPTVLDVEPPSARAERGFSFLEVLIAMSVLIVGSVSILGLFAIGVNRMVQRRVDARLSQVRPEIDSILQSKVDLAKGDTMPASVTREQAEPLSRRGYALAVEWRSSPFETPGYFAHVELLFQGEPVRRLLIPIRRSFINPRELEAQATGKPPGR
jgi:hypothetical protein